MQKLNYCLDCQRIFVNDECEYCNSSNVKELKVGKSVNVIGSKNKGKYLKNRDGKVTLIVYSEEHEKLIKEYDISSIRKIL